MAAWSVRSASVVTFLRAADPAALSAWYRDCLGSTAPGPRALRPEGPDRLRVAAGEQHRLSRMVRAGTVNAAKVPLLIPRVPAARR